MEFTGADTAAAHASGLAVAGYVSDLSAGGRDLEALSVTATGVPRPTSMMLTAFAADAEPTAGAVPGTGFTELVDRDSGSGGPFIRTVIQLREGSSTSTEVGWVGGDLNSNDSTVIYDYTVSYFEVMAAPITIAVDDFNRANGGLGANWTTLSGKSPPQINTNEVTTRASTEDGALWTADTLDADQWVEADITVNTSSTNNSMWLMLRMNSGAGYYCAYPRFGGTNAEIGKLTGSEPVDPVLASTSIGTWTGTRKIRFEAVGNQLTLYADGVEVATVSDSTYTATGNTGLLTYSSNAGYADWDNFSAGDWTDPAGTLRFYPADNYGQQAGSPTTVSNLHWNAGDIIVTMAGGSDASNPLLISSLPTNANLTFTNLGTLDWLAQGFSDARFDYAIAPTSETFQTISQVFTTNYTGIVAWVYTPLSPGSAVIREVASKFNDETTETLNVADNSIVLYGNVDWNANSTDQTLATGSGTATEHADDYILNHWAWVFGDWVGTTAGATAFGLASYSGLASSQMFVEISERNTIVADNFNNSGDTPPGSYTDGNTLDSTTDWSSANYTGQSGVATFDDHDDHSDGTMVVDQSTTGGSRSIHQTAMGDADHWAEVDVFLDTYTNSLNEYGPMVRLNQNFSSGTLDGYVGYLYAGPDSSQVLARIARIDDGAQTTIATTSDLGGTYQDQVRTVRLEAVGSQLTMYVDGVEVATQTDATYTSGLYTGVQSDRNTENATSQPFFDNFSAGDWTAGVSHAITASGSATTTGSAAIAFPPVVPLNPTAAPASPTSITLTWEAVAGASHYDIERNGVVIQSDVVGLTYTDPTATLSAEHDYRVRAVFGAATPSVSFAFTEGVYAENNPTVTPTAPSGSGGILVAVIHRQNGGTVAWNTPGDWTLIDSNLTGWAYNSIERYYTYAANPDLQINYNFADVGVHLYRVTGASGPPHAEFDLFWITGASGAQTMPDVVGAPSGVAIASFAADGFSSDQLPDSFSLGWTVDKNSTWSSTSGAGSTSLHIDHSTTGTFDPGTATFDTTSSCTLGLLIIPTATNEIATDDFNRADETLTASANWTVAPSQTSPELVSNEVVTAAAKSVEYVAYHVGTFADDQWAEADMRIGGDFSQARLVLRCSTSAVTRYEAIVDTFSTGRYLFYKNVAGVGSVIGSWSTPGGLVDGPMVRYRFEVVGSTLTLYADGVEILTETDTDITSGQPGLAVYYAAGIGAETTPHIDNWSAGDWT
jgi:hypothetical protein